MNLAIDIGNSRTKLGLFKGAKMLDKALWETWTTEELFTFATNHYVQNIILSSVAGSLDISLAQQPESKYRIINLDEKTPLPIRNQYLTPATLGKDRLAAVVGAYELFPGKNCLVIDAGTCITYDILTAEGVYLGGNISPGLRMRLKAMHHFTARLPEVEPGDMESDIGNSTETALRFGAQWGLILEVEGFIRRLEARFGEIIPVFTGGDADFLVKKWKSEIFVNQDLVLLGLNKILNHNVECLE